MAYADRAPTTSHGRRDRHRFNYPAASTLGATTTKLPTQRTYVSNLSDSLTTGVGALIGTNMNEAATKLAALQGEQQVGAQALSISNSNAKLILKLFEL